MNYIGSKYSLLDFLTETIETVTKHKNEKENYIFSDLFAGTGVVGSKFRELGYNVISNDIQYYSYVINKHLIENSENIEISDEILESLNNIESVEGFIYNNYCTGGSERNYFSDYNGKKCDAIRMEIEKLYNNEKITKNEYFYLLASLINSIDKYANTASVYGAFLKHLKKSANYEFVLELLPKVNGKIGKVYNKNISELIQEIQGDILYLDPPYNSRQYCSNYHVLETIARYDNPKLFGKTGLRDYSDQKSDFCSKVKIEKVFEELIKNAKFNYIFLSYNNEGIMTLDTIKKVMEKYGDYQVFTKEYKRFRADKENARNHKGNSTIEYLHCLIKG